MAKSSDWRSQLAASQSTYEELFPELNESGPPVFSYSLPNSSTKNNKSLSSPQSQNQSQAKSQYQKIIDDHNFNFIESNEYLPSGKNITDPQRKYSTTSTNYLNTLDNLELRFREIVEKIWRLEKQSVDPATTREIVFRLQGELAQTYGELDKFQSEKVDAVISMNANSGQEIVRLRRKSLNRRCNTLRDELDSFRVLLSDIAMAPDPLPEAINEQNNSIGPEEIEPIPALNIIEPDWSEMIVLQRRAAMSGICKQFCSVVESSSLPLCDHVFEYLFDPEGHAYSLEICSYEFTPTELATILKFFSIRQKLRTEIQKLILFDCNLTDEDCSVISEHIVKFKNLQVLNLRKNAITSEGFSEIVRTLSSNQIKVKFLHFDRNHIDPIGMVELSLALPGLPMLSSLSISHNPIGDTGLYFLLQGLLNKHRNSFHNLPLPSDLQPISEICYLYSGVLALPDNLGNMNTRKSSVRFSNLRSDGYMEEKRSPGDDGDNDDENSSYRMELINRERSRKLHLSSIKRRVKIKLQAFFAFRQRCSRGHPLTSLRVEACNLSDYAASLIAYAVKDNYHLTDLFLSQNPLLLSTPSSCQDISSLIQDGYVRIVEIRNCGVDDSTAKILSQGLSKSSHIMSADLSFNPIGSTGAAWITRATGDLFFDHFGLSTVPVKSYEVDLL